MSHVAPPALLPDAPHALGALAPALRRLAELQGQWPPRPARHRRALAGPAPGTSGEQARDAGTAAADAAVDEGVDLLVVEADGDDSAAALTVLAVLLELEPVAAIGTGGGPGWAALLGAVRSGLPRLRPLVGDPVVLLAQAPDPTVAYLAAALEQAARRRTPVLLGSHPAVVAAALAADRIGPGTARWLLPGSSAAAPAVQKALTALGITPALDLRLPGTGGAAFSERVLAYALELLADGAGSA